MAYGIWISKEGYDVVNGKQTDSTSRQDDRFLPYMISGIALPYLKGAAISLKRFIEAAEQLENNPNNTYTCLHESSSLLEHLDSVDRYVIMCGHAHPLHEKVLNMRNHIRHDLRDNLTHISNEGRIARAKKLGIKEELLVEISFTPSHIKIGETILETSEVTDFIGYSERLFSKYVKEAQGRGLITGSK